MPKDSKYKRAQRRLNTTTYKMVHRSYEDPEYSEENPVMWVTDAELRANHNERPSRRVHFEGEEETEDGQHGRRRARDEDAEEEDEGGYYDEEGEYYEYDEEEEGEWLDGDWDEEEEEGEYVDVGAAPAPTSNNVFAAARAGRAASSGVSPQPDEDFEKQMLSEWGTSDTAPAWLQARKPRHLMTEEEKHELGMKETEKYMNKRNMHMAHDEEGRGDDDQLFEDEVECEVTDDFLRQLVFGSADDGTGGEAYDGEDDEEEEEDDDDLLNDYADEDGEIWRLLTEEEREAIRAARHRGTARKRKQVASSGTTGLQNELTGEAYPTHDVTARAMDRQFTDMMREFNVDSRINDAYTDDPRTHGALSMDKYLSALEEFVVDRAGVDYETSEPARNKGLIQQLKFLAHKAGVFDSDKKGVFLTTLLPDKQARFVEEFRLGTESIRQEARKRVLVKILQKRKQEADRKAAEERGETVVADIDGEDDQDDAKSEEMIIVEVRNNTKADRMDCETAVSAYSTYYNQPNVIRAPTRKQPSAAAKRKMNRRQQQQQEDDGGSDGDQDRRLYNSSEDDTNSNDDNRPVVPTVRHEGETKEEKKLRRQAVKAAQRERRQEKSALKKTYKNLEGEEVKRVKTSQQAKRTVHFM